MWQFSAMKKLQKYIDDHKIRQNELADAIGCHPSTVTRILDGSLHDPKVSLAVAIEKCTDGYVKCEDWLGK